MAGHEGRLTWAPPHPESPFGFVYEAPARAGDLGERLERGVRERSVVVVRGEFFEAPDAFRLAWNLPLANLPAALEQLDLALG